MAKEARVNRRRSGNVLVLFTLSIPLVVSLVGLAVDGTMCYIVQTELSAAVDGAALGAGRLLSTNANPSDIALEFLNANFRVGTAGFWNSYNLTPNISVQTGTTKTVTVAATVNVPLLFMRIFHFSTATVNATATATRRDARVEFVIDRSGSMNTSDGVGGTVIDDVIQYAQGFTQQFTNGYDELGLVVFDQSGVVGYPTTPWPATTSPTGSGGPDKNFNSGATTDMVHQIGAIDAGGGTGMGDALALAYIELQKAHMRDMAALGNDTRMNAIVLFTDGVPSAVSIYPNQNNASLGITTVVTSGSGCTYYRDSATPAHPMYGSLVIGGSPPYSTSAGINSINFLESLDSGSSSNYFMGNPASEPAFGNTDPAQVGCNVSGWGSLTSNFNGIPKQDRYGYSLQKNGVGYKASAIVNGSTSSVYNGTDINFSSTTQHKYAYYWGLVQWNEADQVAEAIRTDANYPNRTGDTSKMSTTIYTIGYTGNGGTDYGLLQKIANMPGSTANGYSTYNNSEPPGLYIEASDKTQLANAFVTIATAILRLAR